MSIAGRWRVTEMELWDQEAMDLIEPAFIEFGEDETGDFGFIAVRGWMDCRDAPRDGRPARIVLARPKSQGSIERVSAKMPGSQCCKHCAEIPASRKEIAELRARLDGLSGTPGDAGGSKPSQANTEQPTAVQSPRQMVLPSPVHGAPLPQADQESSTQDKLGLYRTLFAGRSDVYA